jgi:D-serine deaminase-like pyridoxal phosphate-dependent protein
MTYLPVTDRLEVLEALAAAGQAAGKREAQAQIKVDTGMARLGVRLEDALELLQAAAKLEGVRRHRPGEPSGNLRDCPALTMPAKQAQSDFIRAFAVAARNHGA